MKTLFGSLMVAAAVLPLATLPAPAQAPAAQQSPPQQQQAPRISEGAGSRQFGEFCRTCHGNARVERAPDPAALKRMTPEKIYEAITTGPMKEYAKDLSDADKRYIAEFVAGRRLGTGQSADAAAMPNRCASPTPVRELAAAPSWNG